MAKCNSAPGRAFFFSNIVALRIGEEFSLLSSAKCSRFAVRSATRSCKRCDAPRTGAAKDKSYLRAAMIFQWAEPIAPFDSPRTRTRFYFPCRQKRCSRPRRDAQTKFVRGQTFDALFLVRPS